MSFNYLEKYAKNRTLKYIEQLLKKHDNNVFTARGELNDLPGKARSHVTSELDRVIDSDKKFNDYAREDGYDLIATTNFDRSNDPARAVEVPRRCVLC